MESKEPEFERRGTSMEKCLECNPAFVYPAYTVEPSYRNLHQDRKVILRCAECGDTSVGYFNTQDYKKLMDESARLYIVVCDVLNKFTKANMEEGLETLKAAFDSDALLPEDF